MGLYESLLKAGRLCKEPDCNQHRKAEPCCSYGTCRLTIQTGERGVEGFYYGPPVMKLLDYCWYHEKFGHNGNKLNH